MRFLHSPDVFRIEPPYIKGSVTIFYLAAYWTFSVRIPDLAFNLFEFTRGVQIKILFGILSYLLAHNVKILSVCYCDQTSGGGGWW